MPFPDHKTYKNNNNYYDLENSSFGRAEQHSHRSIYKYYFSDYVMKLVQAGFYVA